MCFSPVNTYQMHKNSECLSSHSIFKFGFLLYFFLNGIIGSAMLKRSLMKIPHCGFANPARAVPLDAVKFWQHLLAQVFKAIFTHEAQFAGLASMLLPTKGTLKEIKEKGLHKARLLSPLHHHRPISTQLKGVRHTWSNIELLFSPSKNLLLWIWSQLTQEEG